MKNESHSPFLVCVLRAITTINERLDISTSHHYRKAQAPFWNQATHNKGRAIPVLSLVVCANRKDTQTQQREKIASKHRQTESSSQQEKSPRPSTDFWLKDNAFVPSSKMLSLLFHFFCSKRNRLFTYFVNERHCIKNLFIVIFFLAETACRVPPFGQGFDRKQ